MGVDIGIVGLAGSGRTTIFKALTRGRADTAGSTPHIGVAKVPEPRLEALAGILHPKRVVPTEVRYIDIGAPVKGIGGQLLNQLSSVDSLIVVVRAFTNETVPHVEGSIDVERDIATMNLELTFSDIAIIERRLEKIEASLKGATQTERQGFLHEKEILFKIKANLEKELPIREQALSDAELKMISDYQFLTAKPLLIMDI